MTESLIIHELDNRFVDEVCREEDNTVLPLEQSLTLSEKGSEHDCIENDWGGKVDQAEEIKVAKHFAVDEIINQKIAFW